MAPQRGTARGGGLYGLRYRAQRRHSHGILALRVADQRAATGPEGRQGRGHVRATKGNPRRSQPTGSRRAWRAALIRCEAGRRLGERRSTLRAGVDEDGDEDFGARRARWEEVAELALQGKDEGEAGRHLEPWRFADRCVSRS